MYEILSADEAIRLIRDGDCICVYSFVDPRNEGPGINRISINNKFIKRLPFEVER